jgi:hypothetical protein
MYLRASHDMASLSIGIVESCSSLPETWQIDCYLPSLCQKQECHTPGCALSCSSRSAYTRQVNLKQGVAKGESQETCSAAVGTLLLEFATLSRLTGEPSYEQVARKAFFALWNRRSDLNLVGNTINIQTGSWIYPVSSVGAGIDSLFEYMIKSYVLFGELEYWRVWEDAYGAVMKHVRSSDGFWVSGGRFASFR